MPRSKGTYDNRQVVLGGSASPQRLNLPATSRGSTGRSYPGTQSSDPHPLPRHCDYSITPARAVGKKYENEWALSSVTTHGLTDGTESVKTGRTTNGTAPPRSSSGMYALHASLWVRLALPNLERRSRMARDMSVHDNLRNEIVMRASEVSE